MDTTHELTEAALRHALADHNLIIRSAAHVRDTRTGHWELAAIRVAPSSTALDRLVADDLALGFVPDDWGASCPGDATNPMSATWRWADTAAQSYNAHYFDPETKEIVRSFVTQVCARSGLTAAPSVLFEPFEPEQLGHALNRKRRTYAAAA